MCTNYPCQVANIMAFSGILDGRVNSACKAVRSSYCNRNVNGLRKSKPRMW